MIMQDSSKCKFELEMQAYTQFGIDVKTFHTNNSQVIRAIIHSYCKDSKRWGNKGHGDDTISFNPGIRFQKTLKALENPSEDFRKDKPFKEKKEIQWTITNDAKRELENDRRSDGQSGTFIRALIEEFVTLPFELKESIVLHEQIKDVLDCIKGTDDDKTPMAFQYTYASGASCIMHPYDIMVDPSSRCTYIVGHRISANEYDSKTYEPTYENVGCIRLLNMLYTNKSRIIKTEARKINEKAIQEKLANTPVSYLSDQPCTIRVSLTPTGENMFRTILHNRPHPQKIHPQNEEGVACYEFNCTIFQAIVYFSTFENHARITYPPKAVDAIKERLRKAYEMYQ